MTEPSQRSIEELKTGYRKTEEGFACCECGMVFRRGEVFPSEGRYFEAEPACARHVAQAHGDMLDALLASDSKYMTLTDVQKKLLRLMRQGLSDKETASEMGVAASTIRHQKFMFREKAKQARMFLAAYALAEEAPASRGDEIMPIHEGATMVDDRYVITEQEREKILANAFTSLDPLHLKLFPIKEKKKIAILAKIAEQFEAGRNYTEKEVNAILEAIYPDYVTIRRYLIEYGYMDRTTDCKKYWMK